jgi:chromosome segregation ATPase
MSIDKEKIADLADTRKNLLALVGYYEHIQSDHGDRELAEAEVALEKATARVAELREKRENAPQRIKDLHRQIKATDKAIYTITIQPKLDRLARLRAQIEKIEGEL